MIKLTQWCKRCFGLKTVQDRMKEELQFAELEIYQITKNIQEDQLRLKFYQERSKMLDKLIMKGQV